VTYVYLSYDRRDTDHLGRLAKDFRRRGIAFRYDPEPPTPQRFDSLVRHMIDACAAVVVIHSATEPQPSGVAHEIEYATATGKSVHELGPAHIDMPDKVFVAWLRAIAPAEPLPPLWWLWKRPGPMLPSTPITFDPERARRARDITMVIIAVALVVAILSVIGGLL
jgi:hypothetical protein